MHTAGLRQLHTTRALVPCRRVVQYVGARPLSSAFPTAKIICFNRIRGRLCSRVRKAASGNCETPSDASSNDGGGNAGGGNKEPQQFHGHDGDDGKPNHARLYPLWLRVSRVGCTHALYT